MDEQRARFGLAALTRDGRLDAAALGHSADLLARGYLSHTSPEGIGPGAPIAAQGYPWTAHAENIGRGHGSAREAVAAWMASPGHCRNVLSPAVRDVGVGVAVGSGGPAYTQVLASTTPPGAAQEMAAAGCPYALDGSAPAGGAAPGDTGSGGGGASRDASATAPVRVPALRAVWGRRARVAVLAPARVRPLVTVDGVVRRVRRAGAARAGLCRYVTVARLRLRGPVRVTVTDGRTSAAATLRPAPAVTVRVRRSAGVWRVTGAIRPAAARRPLTVRAGGVVRHVVARDGRFTLRVPAGRAVRLGVSVRVGGLTRRAIATR